VQWVHRCINAAWNTGSAPKAWKRAALVPIYKKGDKLAADNYRGVTLLDVVGKVYVTVIHSRIRAHLCSQLLQSQCGFVPGKGTGEAMFRLVELAAYGLCGFPQGVQLCQSRHPVADAASKRSEPKLWLSWWRICIVDVRHV